MSLIFYYKPLIIKSHMEKYLFKNFIKIILLTLALILSITSCKGQSDEYLEKTYKAGFIEKQVIVENGPVINYAEGPDNGNALLLIHGQTMAWEDYEKVLPELSKNWHVFAVDCYGHGRSTHDEKKYYLDSIGNDLIWFINNVIKEKTVVSGHSSGALIAAYIAGNGGIYVVGSLLEDPPIFSTEKDYFEKTFAYQDSFKNIHNYLNSNKDECWEAYYLRNCLWGKLYMPSMTGKMADDAQKYHKENPDKPVRISYIPESINSMFLYMKEYDLLFGDHFYDYTWHNGISHEKLMKDIKVPTIFLHAKDAYTKDSILMAASSNDQARKAVSLVKGCDLIEIISGHDIHSEKPNDFIEAINKLLVK